MKGGDSLLSNLWKDVGDDRPETEESIVGGRQKWKQ